MKDVSDLVANQIKERATYLTKSAEAASSSTASPSPSASADPLDELEEGDLEAAPSASATPELEEVPEIYTEADQIKIKDVTEKAQTWLAETRAKQDKLQGHEEPVLTVDELTKYKKQLDDVVMDMMMKKMKHFKPPKAKPTTKPKAKKSASKSKKAKASETPVAPKAGEARTEAEAEADAAEDVKKAGGPDIGSQAGRKPTEEELKAALEAAGVEWDAEKYKSYFKAEGGSGHDEL